jgi:hypothetical protein
VDLEIMNVQFVLDWGPVASQMPGCGLGVGHRFPRIDGRGGRLAPRLASSLAGSRAPRVPVGHRRRHRAVRGLGTNGDQ